MRVFYNRLFLMSELMFFRQLGDFQKRFQFTRLILYHNPYGSSNGRTKISPLPFQPINRYTFTPSFSAGFHLLNISTVYEYPSVILPLARLRRS